MTAKSKRIVHMNIENEIFPDESRFCSELARIFEENRLSGFLNERTLSLFYRFTHILWQTNKSLNLTALTDVRDMMLKHLADSLLISPYLSEGATVIDVGCGGGFPTFPLAIARPDLKITALDSTEKKVNFVKNTAAELGLSNIVTVCGRAEELCVGEMRESFDYATARAVAALPILCELCLPFVKVGGSFVAMKSVKLEEELASAKEKNILALLGGEKDPRVDILGLSFEGEALQRCIAVTKKLSKTPDKYPRAYAQIVKSNKPKNK